MTRDGNNASEKLTQADEMSATRHNPPPGGVTLSVRPVNAAEAPMPISALQARTTEQRTAEPPGRQYFAPMTASARAVAEALRARRPGMGPSRLHSLLYFSQGHHLADLGEPLFAEPLYATVEGALVEDLDESEPGADLANGQLNTIGYVISRYGNLSAADLRSLVRSSDPWRLATSRPEDPRIELAWVQDWFRRADDKVEQGEPHLSREQIADLAERAMSQPRGLGKSTSRESLLARIEASRQRSASAP